MVNVLKLVRQGLDCYLYVIKNTFLGMKRSVSVLPKRRTRICTDMAQVWHRHDTDMTET